MRNTGSFIRICALLLALLSLSAMSDCDRLATSEQGGGSDDGGGGMGGSGSDGGGGY